MNISKWRHFKRVVEKVQILLKTYLTPWRAADENFGPGRPTTFVAIATTQRLNLKIWHAEKKEHEICF